MNVLKLDRVVAAYDDVVCLRGISLEVRRGEIVTLIGANGAGKSTTLKTVSGLLTPREGTIEFDGRAIAGRSPDAIVALGLVQVPEGRRVFPELSVEDNLRVGAYLVDKRAKLRTTLAEVYRRFPRLGGARNSRHAFGRRAAAARLRSSHDVAAEAADAR
jgi:branched-chain amino acid transport system ATP-binding protein